MKNKNWGNFRFALTASSPVFLGYVILGLGYGLYMHNLGFSFWYPTLMAATIYGGSVEFIIATLLLQQFNPLNVLLITAVVGFRQFFYGISMLTKYHQHGWRKFLLLFGLTDETFVINYSLKVPAGYDKQTVQVWISLLDYFYWVLGAFLGGFLGSTLNLQIKGLDFVMTALFIVLALEQFMQEKHHISSLSGVAITLVCLLLFGKTYFLIAALLILMGEYYFLYRRCQKAGEEA